MRVPLKPAPVRVVAARAVLILGFAAAFALATRPDTVQRVRVAPSPTAQPPRPVVPLRSEPASDVTERRERVSARTVALRERRARARAARSAPLDRGAPVGSGSTSPAGSVSSVPAPSGPSAGGGVPSTSGGVAPSTSRSSGSAAPAPSGSPGGGAPPTSGSPGGGASPTRPASGFDSSGTFESER
jgi:hypothetical protein